LLCRECDLPIHRANELTQKHNRFLLTGVKLSATSMDSASSSTNCTDTPTASEGKNPRSRINRPRSVSHENLSSSCKAEDNVGSDTGSVSTSSISEYLIETIPGYCFEELLDGSFAPNGFCKVCFTPYNNNMIQSINCFFLPRFCVTTLNRVCCCCCFVDVVAGAEEP